MDEENGQVFDYSCHGSPKRPGPHSHVLWILILAVVAAAAIEAFIRLFHVNG